METPEWHYQRADELMTKVATYEDPAIPYARALTAQAAVHAQLAQYVPPYYVDADDHFAFDGPKEEVRQPKSQYL